MKAHYISHTPHTQAMDMHQLLQRQFKEQGLSDDLLKVSDADYIPVPGMCAVEGVSPVITLDDMRNLVSLLDVGGITGKTTIIIDHDTAKIFAQLRADMEAEL